MAMAPSSQSTPAPAPAPVPPPPPQHPSGANVAAPAPSPAATSAPPNATRLSFDDVAKHFNVPIAEAATALGVCSSVLKRICRENGVIRWPYRKFLAGKSVDDIKKDAAREKNKEFAELSRIAREKMEQAASSPALAFPASTLMVGHIQEASKLQRGFSVPDHVPQQQGVKLLPDGHGVFQPLQSIPNYVDEFKYGFPVNGLSSATPQWWGGCSSGSTGKSLQAELPCEAERPESESTSLSAPDDAGVPGQEAKAVSLLCSIRKRAVMDGEESIKLGVSRGYGNYKLGKRERSILVQVFKSSLPSQWKYYFS